MAAIGLNLFAFLLETHAGSMFGFSGILYQLPSHWVVFIWICRREGMIYGVLVPWWLIRYIFQQWQSWSTRFRAWGCADKSRHSDAFPLMQVPRLRQERLRACVQTSLTHWHVVQSRVAAWSFRTSTSSSTCPFLWPSGRNRSCDLSISAVISTASGLR